MIQINLYQAQTERLSPRINPQLWIRKYGWTALTALLLALCFNVVLNPLYRTKIRASVLPPYRTVVSVLRADIDGKGKIANILKVKTDTGLYLEVYGDADKEKGGLQPMLASVQLPDKQDGYFTFNDIVTNLVVDDIDNDKIPEILATSFDENLVAHLNMYRYDEATSSLIRVTQTSGNNVIEEMP